MAAAPAPLITMRMVLLFSDADGGIYERGGDDDGSAVLVVVHYGNVEGLDQAAFYLETLGSLYVFEVYPAESGRDMLHAFDEGIGILRVNLYIESVDPRHSFEQHTFALHNGLGRQRAYISEAQHGGAVGYDADEIAAAGIVVNAFGIGRDGERRSRHSRGVGQRQIFRSVYGFRGTDLQLSRSVLRMIAQGFGMQLFFGHDYRLRVVMQTSYKTSVARRVSEKTKERLCGRSSILFY